MAKDVITCSWTYLFGCFPVSVGGFNNFSNRSTIASRYRIMMFDPDPSQKLINAAAACECTLMSERNRPPCVNKSMIDMEIAILRTEPLGLLTWVLEQRRFVGGTRPVSLPAVLHQHTAKSGGIHPKIPQDLCRVDHWDQVRDVAWDRWNDRPYMHWQAACLTRG